MISKTCRYSGLKDNEHQPVLYEEALQALDIQVDGVYIDGTFGRGGHSNGVLQRLGPTGRLFAFDKDSAALHCAQQRFADDARLSLMQASFAAMDECLHEQDLAGRVNGVLLDLGVSSPQLDNAERGFSFSQDGPLDMRMNTSAGRTAADWLQTASEDEIVQVLKVYGEERFARRIARAVLQQRMLQPLRTTAQLADLIQQAIPFKEKHKHPATRSFQAIRIFINNELADLEQGLQAALRLLGSGGRLVVISFHSLEDRIVKRFMRNESRGRQLPRGVPVSGYAEGRSLRLLGKAVRATETEIKANVRARSAVMRVAEKL
ncbi:MAG: 16S rRNA (cytosine(1402)-N(4))-methyltransferase RsmH [gamma proteobacterium symbiont of Bathyaustriella thionipta]|nr:16S rRNA (cytosine(1402)-N(4))-methyltransferase RsmH [gamma proteobacterium symbiont of Bathyaustriella thionipta]